MARKVQIKSLSSLIILVCLIQSASMGAPERREALASFSFDDGSLRPTPETFALFESGKGRVRLSSQYRYSGYNSLEISDFSGDREFPELQGYFPKKESGKIFLRFALLLTNAEEELNIALAGTSWFTLQKNGIAFWVSTKKGWLYHTTDSIPTKLFKPKLFTWYVFKIAYDIDRGRYDIMAFEERNKTPFVTLKDQPNASNQPGSVVDKFSFIGDIGKDTSNVVYYVDDILVYSDADRERQPSQISQQRRSYFIDGWYELKKASSSKPLCPAIFELGDMGFQSADRSELKGTDTFDKVKNVVLGSGAGFEIEDKFSPRLKTLLGGVNSWAAGCGALKGGDGKSAEEAFRTALKLAPDSKIYPLALAIALGVQGRWSETDGLLGEIYNRWVDDPRFDVALAVLGLHRQDLILSAKVLEKFSETMAAELKNPSVLKMWDGDRSAPVLADIKSQYPQSWRAIISQPIVAEQYFYVLLWQGKNQEAYQYAEKISGQLKAQGANPGVWDVFAGDALFYHGRPRDALKRYEAYYRNPQHTHDEMVLGRLSDVYFQLGDFKNEQVFRVKMFEAMMKR